MLKKKESACQSRRCVFNPWVRKTLWRKTRQCLPPVFLPGKSHGQYSCRGHPPDRGVWRAKAHGVAKELDTT